MTPSRRRKHIVPGDYSEGMNFTGGAVSALCDRTVWTWDGRKGWLYQVAECTRCAKAAKELASANAPAEVRS